MSAMTEQFSADVEAVEPEMPVSFRFKGNLYAGQKNQTVDTFEMGDAGLVQKFDFQLDVRVNEFGTDKVPKKNDDIEIADFDGNFIRYRVDRITLSQDGVLLALACVQSN